MRLAKKIKSIRSNINKVLFMLDYEFELALKNNDIHYARDVMLTAIEVKEDIEIDGHQNNKFKKKINTFVEDLDKRLKNGF